MSKSYTPSVLLIYTGGTIGMIENPESGVLEPFNFEHLIEHVTELKRFGFSISTLQYNPPIDSSEIEPQVWERLAQTIANNYDLFDGFVILHGTDTMAYTASALSFMLENLSKPVILTGSQLPIGMLRTDGKENLIAAIEIAAARENDNPVVPEVCIFFDSHLLRGNRTSKVSAEHFNAFQSINFPALGQVGVHIRYEHNLIIKPQQRRPLKPHFTMDAHVVVLKLFPGISKDTVNAILNIPGLKGVVLETYGSGNAPTKKWFLDALREADERGIVIVNVTQCTSGSVHMGIYEGGNKLQAAGVVCGFDITTEAAVTKLMFLLGQQLSPRDVKEYMECSMVGEFTYSEGVDSKYKRIL